MNVFKTHERIIEDYATYIRSFIHISDQRIAEKVESELEQGKLWPKPLLQFNPAFEQAGTLAEITATDQLHPACIDIFPFPLYRHQRDAILLGSSDREFVVTSGTGSGKSLTYIGTIFNHLLINPQSQGITAIIVYPMNALINSQTHELELYKVHYEKRTEKTFPIRFAQYTGQEKEDKRNLYRKEPPQILLTNYMMLELLLTRQRERPIRDAIFENLKFLVFDELHTYRGRQGGDISMLIRRIRAQARQKIVCIGTSATMVSEGGQSEQRQKVAQVASKIFGSHFKPEQIINETLSRSLAFEGQPPQGPELATSILAGIDSEANESHLKQHPLAIWLENQIALDMQDGQLIRRKPLHIDAITNQLSHETGLPEQKCEESLGQMLLWISKVNHQIKARGSRNTILPFRLHQFIAQTGSVYTTLDQDEARCITLEPGIYRQTEKPIYPNVFSISSGHPFICVSLIGSRLEPREFSDDLAEEGATDGYLILGENIWDPKEDLENLPEAWLKRSKVGTEPKKEKRAHMPRKIFFDEFGNFSESDSLPHSGWFMAKPLLFDPTSGSFFDSGTNERTKLVKLGSEGRSTSTTITAFSIIHQLHQAEQPLRDQKLLSFTDNRQDAALQAGHFNDFIQTVHFRAALYKALSTASNHRLDYTSIGEEIARALDLPISDFANNVAPDVELHSRIRVEILANFHEFLLYRALEDLRRSWRIVLPNLEQCGLLVIGYKGLEELAEDSKYWEQLPGFNEFSTQERLKFLTLVLDFFRMEFAISSINHFSEALLKKKTKEFREKLKAPWSLDLEEKLRSPCYLGLETVASQSDKNLNIKSLGPLSAFGKYVKARLREHQLPFNKESYLEWVELLLSKLLSAGYLSKEGVKGAHKAQVQLYQLRIDQFYWQLGDGETVKPDLIKRRFYKEWQPKPNRFFSEMYRRDFSKLKRLRAEDHTGQLNNETRQDREDRFRADWYLDPGKKISDETRIRQHSISALFCSPTMELGVDIGGLSVVHLRNAPPNPSNYAQRSGRAGRSGQGALVFTYCSSYAAHDRHYFQNQADLVSGVVQAPRIDLCNRELLLTHLHALAISELGLPGLDDQSESRPSLMRLVENTNALPLSHAVRSGLQIPPLALANLQERFTAVIHDFQDELETRGKSWYRPNWAQQSLCEILQNLDDALDRWRTLYRAAKLLLSQATKRIENPILVKGQDEYKKNERLQRQATRQISLLDPSSSSYSNDLSEFYPYRYLAAEGFLPGYNFTRLPIRIFLPGPDQSSGDYISRPRAIALREFGPHNRIYYNGRTYQIARMIIPDASSALKTAKLCTKSGYIFFEQQLELCPFSGANLADSANRHDFNDLLEISESLAEPSYRITCEEEERLSRGYQIETYFSIDGNDLSRVRKAEVRTSKSHLLNLKFIPAARLVHVNSKWRGQKVDGFSIDLNNGDWLSEADINRRSDPEGIRQVKLYTTNIADALNIEPIQPLGLDSDGVITLQYALKRGIELEFQVEPNEIGVIAVGDPQAPNILLYEAAEGSLGVLMQFVQDPSAFQRIIRSAQRICRFDDPSYLAPASYNDLLSYYNQYDHKRIDRKKIEYALQLLLESQLEIQNNSAYEDYEQHYQALLAQADPNSSTERTFLHFLHKNGLRLPDASQKGVEGLYCKPDFYYHPRIWIFCDGTPHDQPAIRQRDEQQRELILDRGDEIWSWHYREDLAEKIAQRPDIFSKVR